jgi:hypothetical protein
LRTIKDDRLAEDKTTPVSIEAHGQYLPGMTDVDLMM